MDRTQQTYGYLETVPIPEPIPELGVEAGARGTVVDVYENGRQVSVEVSGQNGEAIGIVDLDLLPEPHVVGYWDMR
jgi:hypothetical protein